MENSIVVPFDLNTAKKINIGERVGQIVTEKGRNRAEIVYEDNSSIYPLLVVIHSDIGSDFESVIRMLYSFRNGPKSGIKVADPEDNYEWTNKDGNEKYSTKNLPKAHFRWDWRRYTLSKESVDKITEFVDTMNDYRFYRLPLFRATAVKYGWDNPIGEDSGRERKYDSQY